MSKHLTDAPMGRRRDAARPDGKRAARHRARRTSRAGGFVRAGTAVGVAVAATGVAVAAGVLTTSPQVAAQSEDLGGAVQGAGAGGGADPGGAAVGDKDKAALIAERGRDQTSRSDRRERRGAAKATSPSTDAGGSPAETEDLSDADPREIGRALVAEYGYDASQFSCLDSLYVSESNWRVDADNPSSSAYGIPQAMTSVHDLPADYYTSAEAQIRWGLDYIERAYGSPCGAWAFKQGNGWY